MFGSQCQPLTRAVARGPRASVELSRAARADTRQLTQDAERALLNCCERQTVASASYTQSEHITGKLPQAAEVTVRRQSSQRTRCHS